MFAETIIPECRFINWTDLWKLITFYSMKLQQIFEILNVSALLISLWLFCATILSKVIAIFIDMGKKKS